MTTSPQDSSASLSLWDVDQKFLDDSGQWLSRLAFLWEPHRQWFSKVAYVYTAARRRAATVLHGATPLVRMAQSEALARCQRARPVLIAGARRVAPFLAHLHRPETPQEPDPVEIVLGEFRGLGHEDQERVAKNLALLWDNFQAMFEGVSGFLAAPGTEQDAFMDKLAEAAQRMEAARGTAAGFHYVTVELTRQYIAYLRIGRSDSQAVALATCVVALIDQGRRLSGGQSAASHTK